MSVKQISLAYREGSSDKVYHVQIEASSDIGKLFLVNFQYGRRGSTLSSGSKTSSPVSLAEAEKIFDQLVREKMAKGYSESASGIPYVGGNKAERVSGVLPQLLNPIDDAELQEKLNDGSWMQEKHDGRRCLVRITLLNGGPTCTAEGINRKGLTIGLPETVASSAQNLPACIIDGELVGDTLFAFDMLELAGNDMRSQPYSLRLAKLASLYPFVPSSGIKVVITAKNREDKKNMLEMLKQEGREGVVFKDPTARYKVGRPSKGGDQLKYKFYATASCLVSKVNAKRSVALQVFNEVGTPVAIGNVTIPPSHKVPKDGDVVEVRYLYAYHGGSLYQPICQGVRDDIEPAECTEDQLKYKAGNAEDDDA